MLDPDLIEQIDACRMGSVDRCPPGSVGGRLLGSDDIEQREFAGLAKALASDAELRATYDAVQRLDGRIVAALDDLPVPGDLKSRILARLAATSSAACTATSSALAAAHDGAAESMAAQITAAQNTAAQSARWRSMPEPIGSSGAAWSRSV